MGTLRTASRQLLMISLCSSLLSIFISAGLLTVQAAQLSTGQNATEAVKRTITDLIAVLDDEALKQPGRADERRHKIEDVIRRGVDYEEMAKRALGRPWLALSEQDRQEFVSLFVQLLRDSFAGRITEHHDEQVDYLSEQREDLYAEVRTQLKGRKIETPIDFRLISHGTEWRVYDVVIDGASIVNNYRSQFASIIREVSYAGLVQKMKQKAVAVKVFENTPSQ
ncbi:MlaC/ttg2D family ABC transporter substrate-binding protein [Petrachloros mirabilis]